MMANPSLAFMTKRLMADRAFSQSRFALAAVRLAAGPSIRRVAVDATLVAVVLIFAQPVFVALVVRIRRDVRQGQAEGRRLWWRRLHHRRWRNTLIARHRVVMNAVMRRISMMMAVMHGRLFRLRISGERT